MKLAVSYKIEKTVILHSDCKTTVGVWILCGHPVAVACDEVFRLGDAILDALDGSRQDVPHPTCWKGLFDPVLRLAGVRSRSSFVKKAKCVLISSSGNRILFTPMKNRGAKEGFGELLSKKIDSAPEPGEFAKTLLTAFEACE